jgi:hypothetical protein
MYLYFAHGVTMMKFTFQMTTVRKYFTFRNIGATATATTTFAISHKILPVHLAHCKMYVFTVCSGATKSQGLKIKSQTTQL